MQSVTVHVKVILVGMPEHVQIEDSWQGLTKLERVVGGATGTCCGGCYWDDPNCPFGEKIGCSQQVADVYVKDFQGKNYLSVPEKGTIVHIDDIDDVAEME